MITIILYILFGIIVTIIFGKIRSYIIKKIINKNQSTNLNASIGKVFNKEGKEVFNWKKFLEGFFSFDVVQWAKDFISVFNIRKLIFYILILGTIYGVAYYRGQQGKPITIKLNNTEAIEIQVPNSDLRLYKPKDSSDLYWIDKDGNKTHVKVADIPALKRALAPFGIVFEPYAIGGIGIGKKVGGEGGVGFHWLKYYRWRISNSLTNRGIYIGTSYKLTGLGLDNTAINLSYGKGWDGDNRYLIGIAIEF